MRNRGGVGIYLNNALVYSVREDLSRMFTFIECIFVKIIQQPSKNIIVGCVYRPPDTDVAMFNTEMAIILDILNVGNKKLAFVLGDFNVDLIKSDIHTPTSKFLNKFSTHSFIPTILYPTSITDATSTLVDDIFVNTITNQFDTAIIYSDLSDHLLIFMHFDVMLPKPKPILEFAKPLYTSQTIDSFRSTLSEIDWNAICLLSTECDNPSECYSLFITKYLEVFHDHFPTRSRKPLNKSTPRHD